MNCWQILGIAPTGDERAIKRGYFTQLKANRPEDDAQAFQVIRQAYENALYQASQPWLWPDTDEPEEQQTSPPICEELTSDRPFAVWFPDPSDETPPDAHHSGADSTQQQEHASHAEPASQLPAPVVADSVPAADLPPLEKASEIVVGIIYGHIMAGTNEQDVATGKVAALWNMREWQMPEAERALEQAWMQRLAGMAAQTELLEQLYPLVSQVSGYYAWYPQQPSHRSGITRDDWELVRDALVRGSVARVWNCIDPNQPQAALAAFAQQVAEPLFAHLDMRQALAGHWAQQLMDAQTWPSLLVETLFGEFGWEHDHNACPSALWERYRRYRDRSLLVRITKGQEKHDDVDMLAARALMAPRLGWKVWEESVLPAWHKRMNRALIWLAGNAPDALQAVQPKVLRWWTSPRPQSNGLWNFTALMIGIYVLALVFNVIHPPSDWLWLLIVPVVFMAAAWLGHCLIRGLAWLRVIWAVKLYFPWSTWDQRLAGKIPIVGRRLLKRGIGPTRDLLPLTALYGFELFGLMEKEANSPLWENAVVALVVTLFVGVFWYGGLRLFAGAPGAMHWLELKGAGVLAAIPAEHRVALEAAAVAARAKRKFWFTRALGVLVLSIGIVIGVEWAINTPRSSEAAILLFPFVMIVLGGWVAWRPNDLQ